MTELTPFQDSRDLIDEDETMTLPAEPSRAPSVPASTHTPYPDVLNPVDDSQAANVSFAPPMAKQPLQQQEGPQYANGILSSAQHRPASVQNHSFHATQNTEQFHLPPSFTEHGLDSELSAYNSLLNTSSGYEQAIFPGWFVTSFDEHVLFAGPEFRDINYGLQERVY